MRSPSGERCRRALRLAGPVLVAVLLIHAGVAGAARPLDTEDTGTVDPGNVELELSATWETAPSERASAAQAALNVGITPGFQLKVASGLEWFDPDDAADHVGVGDTFLGAKFRLLEETERRPAALVAVTLRLPTGDDERGLGEPGVDVGVLAVISKTFGPLTLTGNGGYTFVTDDREQDFVTLAASAEYRVTEAWALVGEVFSEVGIHTGAAPVVLRGGSTYAIAPRIRLDGAVGVGLTDQSPDAVVTVGVTIAF